MELESSWSSKSSERYEVCALFWPPEHLKWNLPTFNKCILSRYSCNWGLRRGEGWLVVVVFLGRWIEFQEFAKPSRGITLAGKLLFWTSRYFVENSRYKIGAQLIQGWILSKNNAHWWCFPLFIYCLSNLLIYISLPNALNIFPFSHLLDVEIICLYI